MMNGDKVKKTENIQRLLDILGSSIVIAIVPPPRFLFYA
jgi:hypothetical protein